MVMINRRAYGPGRHNILVKVGAWGLVLDAGPAEWAHGLLAVLGQYNSGLHALLREEVRTF